MKAWILFGAGAAAVVVALVATGLGWWDGGGPAAAASATPLAVHTSLEQGAVLYGDQVVADVEVDYDPGAIASGSIRVRPDFTPFVAASAPETSRSRGGGGGHLRLRYSLLCVTEGCLPTNGPRQVKLGPVKVTATAGARTLASSAPWPPLVVASRLAPSDLAGSIHFRHPATLPAPEYAVAPGPLAGGLIAAAALLALAALALIGRALGRRRGRIRSRRLTPLEVALAYARDSASRPDPGDRRRALELLAEAVGGDGEPALASAAAETAWSYDPPTPARAVELADEVEAARAGSE